MTATPLAEKPMRTYRDFGRPLWRRIFMTHEMAIIGLLVVVVIIASVTLKGFFDPRTISYLLPDLVPVLLLALPMTLIIITGEIDLSVASTAGLAGVAFGIAFTAGIPVGLAIVVALLVGVAAGAINGFFITVVGLPSLAVTIGTLALFRGLAVGLIGTDRVGGFPEELRDLALDKIPGTPIMNTIILFVVLAIVFAVVLHFTPVGRGIFAIGLSSEAARFSGVRIERTKFVLFVISGLIAGLTGVFYALKSNIALADNTTGLELSVIAAVLLGGVSIFGGRGALHGVIAGVLLIGVVGSALRLAGLTSDVISIVTGVLLVASVVTTSFLAWLRVKRVVPGGKKGSPGPVQ